MATIAVEIDMSMAPAADVTGRVERARGPPGDHPRSAEP